MPPNRRIALRDHAARNALIEAGDHFRLVRHVIRRTLGDEAHRTAAVRRAGGIADVIQGLNRALLRAAELYDPAQGDFAGYATWFLRGALLNILRTEGVVRGSWRGRAPDVGTLKFDYDPAGEDEAPGREHAEECGFCVRLVMGALPERLALLLRLRYLEGRRPPEVAARLGVTTARFYQLERQALEMGRRALARAGRAELAG